MIYVTGGRPGFTIVELLIVIVIIAILAAITIVAFNGLTDRANQTQTISAVQTYAKNFARYAIDNNATYPVSAAACLGATSFGSCGNVGAGGSACFGLGGVSGSGTASTNLRSTLSSYFSGNFPNPSNASYSCGAGTYTGAFYYSVAGTIAYIYVFLKSDGSCPAINGMTIYTQSTDNAMLCRYQLPTVS